MREWIEIKTKRTAEAGGRKKRPIVVRWRAFLATFALTGVLAGIATGSETTSWVGPGLVPVLSGCEPDDPPYCIVTPDTRADGFSVELRREARKAMGREVVFMPGPWAELKGNPALRDRFNEGLRQTRVTGEYRKISSKWLGMLAPDSALRQMAKTVLRVSVSASLLAALALGIIFTLRHQVRSRTRELSFEKAFLDHVINAIGDPVFVKNEKRRFVIVNDALCAFVGRPREGLLGQDGDNMFPPEQVEVFRKVDAGVLDTGAENLNEEALSNLTSGEVRTIVTRKSRYVDPDGKRFLVGVIRDITEPKMAEVRLRQQQNLASIGTLARGMAHEVNNPIMGIANYAQLIKDRAADNAGLAGFADEIIAESQRVAWMTHSLLNFTQYDSTQAMASAALADIVASVLPPVTEAVWQRGIDLSCDIPADLPPVACHMDRIGEAVRGLLTNAVEALDEGTLDATHVGEEVKTIRVGARRIERAGRGWLRLSVEDNGPGIPQAIRDRVFDPFFTTKDRTRHAGLNLWIARSIVQEQGGALTFETEVGKFTRMHMDLPVKEAGGVTLDPPKRSCAT
jgi:PAS domain S-box-containing protein